ncbi:MAG: PGF-CTERM sorting domain-containing protein [Halopenitus sp.]
MRQRAFTLTMAFVLVVSALAGPAGVAAASTQEQASVSFSGGTSGGSTIVVDEVTLPEGGFVTIHDNSLTKGNVLGSVVGTSTYLEPGTHQNVTVTLDESVEDGQFHAMAHKDTDNDRAYEFVSSNGEVDGPYTVDGNIVMQASNVTVSASVSASDQPTEGEYVIVDRVELSEAGFVTIHDSSLLDGKPFGSILGSKYLEAGVHKNVRVKLDQPLESDDTIIPMAHKDTNDNKAYDFKSSEGQADGPFKNADGKAVIDTAQATLSTEASVSFSAQSSGGTTVVVDQVFLPNGGFVTLHDSTLADGAVIKSIRGTSEYLKPGVHRNVEITLSEPLEKDDKPFAMAHKDTNNNQAYDFPSSEGEDDGPYTTNSGNIVMQQNNVTVSAAVDFNDQTSDGKTVVVEDVDLSQGGFVTIHDASLKEGAVLESVRGTSKYLEAGHHEEVVVTLNKPIQETNQLLAMAHKDTNDNKQYDFVDSGGEADGPFTANGNIVMTQATAEVTAFVSASNQEAADGKTIVVDEVTLHNGGFVTIHDSSLLDGAVFDSVRGTSKYLGPGTHKNVKITLDKPLKEDATVIPMAHKDTNNNQQYDFLSSDGQADGPYVAAGGAVITTADVNVEEMTETPTETMEETEMQTETMQETEMTTETESSAPGFGAILGLVALLAAALIATRRQ